MGCHQSRKEIALHMAGPPHTHVTITAESVLACGTVLRKWPSGEPWKYPKRAETGVFL